MMSDHWKLLANILGTPGPAEPVAKETTKKKSEPSHAEPKSGEPSATPGRDPLADIVVRKPDPVVPGFVVPEPPAAPEKPPAKRSAWDSLIGSLGIKTAAEPDVVEDSEPTRSSSTPAAKEATAPSRGFANEPTSRDRVAKDSPRHTDAPRQGFGSGLVADSEDVAWAGSVPHERAPDRGPSRTPEPRSSEPRSKRTDEQSSSRSEPAARRDATGRESRGSEPRGSEPRGSEPREARSSEFRQSRSSESRPARSSEPRSSEPRSSEPRSSEPRSSEPRGNETRSDEPRRGDVARPRGFGDGLLDWDTPDDVFVTDEDEVGDELSPNTLEQGPSSKRQGSSDRARSDEDRPRGRGRRGGGRNRGRGSEPSETPARIADDEDVIGWHEEIDDADDADELLEAVDQPVRHDADSPARRDRGRSDRPRSETDRPRSDGGRPERRPRGDASSPVEPPRGREGARRDEPRRDEPRRDEPRRDEPRSNDSAAEETAGDSRRRGRRGQRQQMGAPAKSELRDAPARGRRDEPPRTSELEFGDDDDDLIIEELAAPLSADSDATAEEGVGRPRRRRGRRGRGGSGAERAGGERVAADREEPSARGELDEPAFAAELDAIEVVELDDDHEDDDEAERMRRGRRRGRERSESRPRTEAASDAVPMAADGDDEIQAPKHRNVPTWLDTIHLLVDANIERHRRTGPPRPPQGRGSRR